MRVVSLPGGEEHGEARNQCSEDSLGRGAQSQGGCLAEAGKRAVEGVNAMTALSSTWVLLVIPSNIAHSKSSPSPLDWPVRLACLPSTLSIVEYLDVEMIALVRAKMDTSCLCLQLTSTTQEQSCNTAMMVPMGLFQ